MAQVRTRMLQKGKGAGAKLILDDRGDYRDGLALRTVLSDRNGAFSSRTPSSECRSTTPGHSSFLKCPFERGKVILVGDSKLSTKTAQILKSNLRHGHFSKDTNLGILPIAMGTEMAKQLRVFLETRRGRKERRWLESERKFLYLPFSIYHSAYL